ncbi:MAG: tRNA epoxyqueuosine(34) reductase QueG [Chloroflexi bacterium]|nr:tRNA epoxyqueuosine(34) reductase QueG [Chloroflexota bacterium]
MLTRASPSLKALVVRSARGLGFHLVRVTTAEPMPEHERIARERVRQGCMEGMPWFTEGRAELGSNPQALLPGARSIIVVGVDYLPHEEGPASAPGSAVGRVARYAPWSDYHGAMKERLRALVRAVERHLGRPVRSRVFVDDSPLLERAVAERAGLGWFGKNTNILTPTHGSWVFLGAVITDLELEPDGPLKKSCGSCIRCIPACPTGAIVAPYVIDATRCISYLTIECRGPIPRHLRPLVGDWLFGCDICQEVCPVNRDLPSPAPTGVSSPLRRTGFSALELVPLLSMTEEEFRKRFRDSPVRRAKRVGLQRNACVVLGNLGDRTALPALGRVLREGEPLVRGHAAWALGRLGGAQAARLLQAALAQESDPWVREEICVAVEGMAAEAVDCQGERAYPGTGVAAKHACL